VNDVETSKEVRRAQSELLTLDTVLRRMHGAISYECWTDLDFNNELKGGR